MNKLSAGFIGFIPRDPKVNALEYVEKYAAIGYVGFETGSLLLRAGDPVENLKKVKDYGIRPLSLAYDRLPGLPETDLNELVENAHLLGIDRITTYSGACAMYRFGVRQTAPSYDELMAETEGCEAIAERLASEGLTYVFHNHDMEFKFSYNGVPALYVMAQNSEKLQFELDCAWCQYAGQNVPTVIGAMADRLSYIHVKDYIAKETPNPRVPSAPLTPQFTAVGTGLLDLEGCLQAASEAGIQWAIVEQESMNNLSEVEALTAAYLNMKERGYVG